MKASMGGWWPVSNPSHQLNGITGGLSIPPNLCKHPKGPDSPENGQYLSSNIHKSKGRHSLNPAVQSSLGNLGMVPPKAINNPSRTSPVLGSLNLVVNSESRRIKDQCSWMINPKNFQQIQQSLGPLQTNLFTSSLTKQLIPLLQLEAGSRSRSDGFF